MRIAVSAESDNGLKSEVSPHFGRCPYYALVDLDEENEQVVEHVRTVANPYYGHHQPGQIPAFIHSQGVNVMVAGGMGAGAISYFGQLGIDVATGASGSVREAIERYQKGELNGGACCPGDHDHHSSCH